MLSTAPPEILKKSPATFSTFAPSTRIGDACFVWTFGALPEIVNDTVRRRGYLKVNSDYAIPLDRNLEMLAHYHHCLRELSLDYVIFGHIGDAHVHVNILPKSEAEFKAGQDLMLQFARHAVELGGTVSAEHGLGKRKAHLLALQYTPAQIEAMRDVKRRLDPNWLLNPGNIFRVECG